MPRLKLDDRTYEDDDGTWTTMEFQYCHPWENDSEADVYVRIDMFKRQEGKGFDFAKPDKTMTFHLKEMEAVILHGFLGAAATLMPRQWAEYQAQEARVRTLADDKAAA